MKHYRVVTFWEVVPTALIVGTVSVAVAFEYLTGRNEILALAAIVIAGSLYLATLTFEITLDDSGTVMFCSLWWRTRIKGIRIWSLTGKWSRGEGGDFWTVHITYTRVGSRFGPWCARTT